MIVRDDKMFEIPKKCRLTGTAKGTAVVYIRTNSETEPIRDLRQQAKTCFDFCAKNMLAVLKVFAEQCSIAERGKELIAAQSLCSEYEVTYLVVDMLSRVATGVTDIERVENSMFGRGTSLLAAKLPGDGANELSLYGSLSDAFRKRDKSYASERTKLGMHRATERGKICHRLPAGIKVKKQKTILQYDPVKAPLIKMGFLMLFSQMFSIADIAKMLGKKGLVNEKTGKSYALKTIKMMFSNPLYKGCTRGADGYYYKLEGLEPLVEEKIFDEVQKILKDTKSNPLKTRDLQPFWSSGDEWLSSMLGE